MDTKQEIRSARHRRHSDELKNQVLAECAQPGASVAQVAMAYALNANLVHKWRRQARARELQPPALPSFIPVEITAPQAIDDAPQFIELQLQRAGLKVQIRWPLSAAPLSAAWLREVLR